MAIFRDMHQKPWKRSRRAKKRSRTRTGAQMAHRRAQAMRKRKGAAEPRAQFKARVKAGWNPWKAFIELVLPPKKVEGGGLDGN